MLREGIIEPVDTSDWATPLVPVRKADGGLRICADYKVTLNPVLLVDRYPLPKIDDLLVNLNGAQIFSKIDLSQAYNQIELDDSKALTVINTHRGLFKYNRLVFGLASSPGIFQRIMSTLLKGIPGVEIFLDDIIIGTKGDQKQHLKILEEVLNRLKLNGMKLKRNKCHFMLKEVKYLGYIISSEGVKVDEDKVAAVLKIPRPRDVPQLRSFLGLINFYAKFVKNVSSVLAPLYELLKKGVGWKWSAECERAFVKIKDILTSAPVLAHYDTNKPLVLTCDASAVGIGGVLTQAAPDGSERAVVYVSRALTCSEKHYSQIDKEALAIVYCLKKLHQYLYGRRFTLRTDHKPLVSIFGPKYGVPAMAASRLQRWAIILSAYTYDIEYVNTRDNGADGLSRLVAPAVNEESCDVPEQSYLHFAQDALLLDYNMIKNQTMRDPLLSRVLCYIRDGWPGESEIREMQPYYNRKKELYEELGCVMWGYRVVIPEGCRSRVLAELHEAHMGIVKTKAMARSYVWWPGVDEAVEAACRACGVCAREADAPPHHAVASWPWPGKPWTRIHIDFLGPLFNKLYLIVVDAHTKWIEVFPVPSTAACHTIDKLKELFGRFGLVRQLVSDNGPPFQSKEVADFLKNHGIEHIFSAPYHPASNGAAENAVRTIKKAIKKAVGQNMNVMSFVNTFLLHYRNTEHCTTGVSPASLMLGRRLRTKLDMIRPDKENRVRERQEKQKESRGGVERTLEPGEEVWLRQYAGQQKWVPGRVSLKLGTTDYRVVDDIGKESHRHIDQLRRRVSSQIRSSSEPSHTVDEAEGAVPVPGVEEAVADTSALSRRGSLAVTGEAQPVSENDSEGPRLAVTVPPPIEPSRSRPIRQCRLKNKPLLNTS
ncbi:uncharacterized protein K02A2.6-like [Maniola jurtina]|nr:uncharacterized protein K02A2.6-like [Maniola jurtina]